jgi:hypothetical protein
VSRPRTRDLKQTNFVIANLCQKCTNSEEVLTISKSSPCISGPLATFFRTLAFGVHNGESTVAQLSVN